MQTKYIQKYNNDDNKIAKIILLSICILLDLIALAGIIACFSAKRYIDLIIYAAVFAVALAIRFMSLFFTYQISIDYSDGNLVIIKKFPIKEKILYNGKAENLSIKKFDADLVKEGKKYVRLCPKSCEDCLYMIELSKRKYIICLDDYLFSLIEVDSDLS